MRNDYHIGIAFNLQVLPNMEYRCLGMIYQTILMSLRLIYSFRFVEPTWVLFLMFRGKALPNPRGARNRKWLTP